MNAYYQTHPIGVLYLLVVLGWYAMEIIQFALQRQWRAAATRTGPRSFWPAFWPCMAVATAMLFLEPHIAPWRRRSPNPAVGFVIGMVMLVTGVAVRIWSFQALGEYFTFTVKVSADQPVIASGPFRLLRHPGYAGGLLLATLDGSYGAYAAQHKRLIPLVW